MAAFLAAALVGSAAAAGEGDDLPIDDAIQLKWALIDDALFRDPTSLRLGVLEQREKTRRRTEESRRKRLWLVAEGQAFSKLTADLLEDTETARRRRDKLREASETAARFTSAGVALPLYRARFVDLVMMTAVRGEVRELMSREIGPIGTDDFVGHRLHEIVLPGGDLDPPPPSLLATVGRIDGEALFRRLRADWLETASAIRSGREPAPERLAAMWSVLDEWEAGLIEPQEHSTPAAVNYVENARRLVTAANGPSEREAVAAFLKNGGHAFPGGTYGDLLFHVVKHRLAPKAGTPGSLAVGELTQAMIDRAEAEIAQLDVKIEKLKRQSPAHNAVLRERMVPRYFSDKTGKGSFAGLDSPAFDD